MNTGGWLTEFGFVLNGRERASLVWLGVLAIVALSSKRTRTSLIGVLRAAFAPKLLRIWVAYVVWIAVLIQLLDVIGLWRPVVSKDTIVWATTAGLVLLATFTDVSKSGFFRSAIRKTIGVSVFLEYLVTLATFSLWVELALQPFVFFFAAAPIVVRDSTQRSSWSRTSTRVSLFLLVAITGNTARVLFMSWESVEWALFVFRAIWPVVLALWVLPAVFVVAIVSSYERAFLRLDLYLGKGETAWKPKLALKAYQANLGWHAGSEGNDEDGRALDKREFRETVRALEWLHTCQIGWYRREPKGYKPNLIDLFRDDFSQQGIPSPAGVSLSVSEDGQRWYAWRRTPSGRYFGIGASEPPPSQWLYDGTEPPQDFPGLGALPYTRRNAPCGDRTNRTRNNGSLVLRKFRPPKLEGSLSRIDRFELSNPDQSAGLWTGLRRVDLLSVSFLQDLRF